MSSKDVTTEQSQCGYAVLVVVLILLFASTIVTFYGAQVVLTRYQLLSNDLQNTSARKNAVWGHDTGFMLLTRNIRAFANGTFPANWQRCAESATDFPCGNGRKNVFGTNHLHWKINPVTTGQNAEVHVVVSCRKDEALSKCKDTSPHADGVQSIPDTQRAVHLIAMGRSDHGAATRVFRQSAEFYSLLFTIPAGPLLTRGRARIQGRLDLVANPDGGGDDVPVSVWSAQAIDAGSRALLTCQVDEYNATNRTCPSGSRALSTAARKGPDVIDEATDFPADLFDYLFGIPASENLKIKDRSAATGQVVEDCRTLDADSAGLFWIEGDCQIQTTVGSPSSPVLLLVVDARLTLRGETKIYGMIFSFGTPTAIRREPVKMRGDVVIYGSLLTDGDFHARGRSTIYYDSALLKNLRDSQLFGIAPVPGSWADYHGL